MKKIKILLITLMITALSPLKVFADKSDDTLVAAFSRELTQLDYHYGTKTEFLILGDMIDSGLFYVKREDLSYAPDIASDFKIIDDIIPEPYGGAHRHPINHSDLIREKIINLV